MLKTKRDSILNATETIIAHQVNCQGITGGLAGEIFSKWPAAGEEYKTACCDFKAEQLKGKVFITSAAKDGNWKIIVNLFGQIDGGENTDTTLLNSALNRLSRFATANEVTIALPYKIGCGIGGADWKDVCHLINTHLKNNVVTIYQLPEDKDILCECCGARIGETDKDGNVSEFSGTVCDICEAEVCDNCITTEKKAADDECTVCTRCREKEDILE